MMCDRYLYVERILFRTEPRCDPKSLIEGSCDGDMILAVARDKIIRCRIVSRVLVLILGM